MIDPNSPEYAIWSSAQREAARICAAWQEELQTASAAFAAWDNEGMRAEHKTLGKEQLLAKVLSRGPCVRREAAKMSKADLIDWLIKDERSSLEARIARLEQLIDENQPSLYWHMAEGNTRG